MPRSFKATLRAAVGWASWLLPLGFGCSLQDLDYLSNGTKPIEDAGAGGSQQSSSGGGSQMGAEGDADLVASLSNNLIADPGFELGTTGWTGFGTSQVTSVRDNPHSGEQCLGSVGREETWMGPSYPLTTLIASSQVYSVSAWVRISEGASVVSVSTKTVCPNADAGAPTELYTPLGTASATSQWVEVRGSFAAPTCTPTEFRIYLEGPPASVDLFLDDVSVVPIDS